MESKTVTPLYITHTHGGFFGQSQLYSTFGVVFIVKPLRNTPIFRFSGNSVFCTLPDLRENIICMSIHIVAISFFYFPISKTLSSTYRLPYRLRYRIYLFVICSFEGTIRVSYPSSDTATRAIVQQHIYVPLYMPALALGTFPRHVTFGDSGVIRGDSGVTPGWRMYVV